MHVKSTHTAKNMASNAFEYCCSFFTAKLGKLNIPLSQSIRLNTSQLDEGAPPYCDFLEENKRCDQIPSYGAMHVVLKILYTCLDYIEMSPKKADIHEETYVIDKARRIKSNIELFIKNTHNITLNECKGLLVQIVDFWIDKAKQLVKYDELSLQDKISAREMSIYYLLGEPGIGKTALLNYVFSTKAKELRKNNLIWIRADLNDPHDVNLGLRQRLCFKFIRIFAKHYINNPKYPLDERFFNNLKHYINNNKPASMLKQEAVYYTDQFIRYLIDINDSENNGRRVRVNIEVHDYDINLAELVLFAELTMTFLQKRYGYSYILMFDGLDSVTLDRVQYELYCSWLEEIMSVLNNRNNSYKAVYLVTMRDYSFINYHLQLYRTKRFPQEEYIIMRVQQMPLYDILVKRFDYALKILSKQNVSAKRVQLWNIKNNLTDIVNMCLYGIEPKQFSDEYVSNKKIKRKDYDMIMSLCNSNFRAVMRFFRQLLLVLSSILGDQAFQVLSSKTGYNCLKMLDGKHWAIHRVLLFGDIGAKAYRNRIGYDINGAARVVTQNSVLVPNIFNFMDTGLPSDKPLYFPRNLLKIRTIQLLQQTDGVASVQSLIQKLKLLYGDVPDKIIRADIREMIFSGLIYPKVEQTDFMEAERRERDYFVSLTKLSSIIIDCLIKRNIYHEIVCDDTPIDLSYVRQKLRPLNRYDSSVTLSDYLIRKTYAVVHFLLYLERIEAEERKKWDTHKLGKFQEIFSQNLYNEVRKDIESYIYKYLVLLRDKQTFIADWNVYFEVQ